VAEAITRGELPRATEPGEVVEGMTMSEVFAALANGVVERDLVPVRGQRREVVEALTQAWLDDASGDGPAAGTVTRAGMVNALTRWAHRGQDDAFFADKVQVGASALLWPETSKATAPPAIPALPLAKPAKGRVATALATRRALVARRAPSSCHCQNEDTMPTQHDRSRRRQYSVRGSMLEPSSTLRDVERAIRTRRLTLSSISQDADGFFVRLDRGRRRYTGLAASLLGAVVDALDDADTDGRIS